MADRAFYDFRAPQFVDFTPTRNGDKSAFVDMFDNSGNMDIDISFVLPSEPGARWSSTPNKRDSYTQTPSERTEEEEGILSDALDTILRLERTSNRRSVRFNDAVDFYPKSPNTSVAEQGRDSGSEKSRRSGSGSNKRQTTPIIGTWHQALKYRSVEQRTATPRPGRSRGTGLLADPTLKIGNPSQTPSSIPRPIQVKVRVDPKPVVKVEPFQLTTYKPRQSPLEDPVKFFQRTRDTPVRQTQAKPAVRRLPLTENKAESPQTPSFRAKPPASLYQKPFVPKPAERPPIKPQPFRLHTEERAKKREEYDHKIQQHLLELEAERQRLAEQREREEAVYLKELRKVKIHARPVPSFVYSPVLPKVDFSPKTPSVVQTLKTSTKTI